MEQFDKSQALDVIEDALTDVNSARGRGLAVGLCGAFYMCGLLNEVEWKTLLARIPGENCCGDEGQEPLNQTKH